jgi:hypothetical protein
MYEEIVYIAEEICKSQENGDPFCKPPLDKTNTEPA